MFKILCLGFAGLIFLNTRCGDDNHTPPNLQSTIIQKLEGLPADLHSILENEEQTWQTWNVIGALRFFADGSIRKLADDLDVQAYTKKAQESGIEKLPATQMYQWLLKTTATILEETGSQATQTHVVLQALAKAVQERYLDPEKKQGRSKRTT